MRQTALDKKNLKKLAAAMLEQGRVRGPVRDARTGMVVLGELSAKSELVLDYGNFKLPPKREFFPQCEVIARYDAEEPAAELPADGSVIIFGVRPCDAQSFRYLDKVFSDETATDPYYRKRRDNALVVTLACEKPGPACFCSSVGGSPAGQAGADIVAFNLGHSLLFEVASTKGEFFLNKNKKIFREPAPEETHRRKQQVTQSLKQLPELHLSDASKKLAKNFASPLWETISETCLGCGACTYLCPTCHCFDLYDELQETGGMKFRVHDACMFASFTREASGHNPRSSRRDRMRQRVMHKFSYAPENFSDLFCVGCGRCIVNCPSNIDIRETIAGVTA